MSVRLERTKLVNGHLRVSFSLSLQSNLFARYPCSDSTESSRKQVERQVMCWFEPGDDAMV